MEEIFGYVEGIVFAGEDNGFVVAKIKEPHKKDLTFIVGTMPGVQIGESIRCKGTWKIHSKFGQQFEVKSFESQAPTDLVGIQKYLESGMIKGIGPAYAKRIVDKFGIDTLGIIDEKPAKLLTVPGIGEKRVEKIIKCWEEQREIRLVMIFLRGHGVSPSFAQKIYKTYGDKSIEIVNENPYRLAKEIFGVGFKSADQIAQNLGIEKTAMTRVTSGIAHVLWELSSDGHVCYPKEDLIDAAKAILEVDSSTISEGIKQLIISQEVVFEEEKVWIKPLYLAEMGIARELKRLQNSNCSLREVDIPKAVDWVQEKLRMTLAKEQRYGVEKAISEKLLILTGGPGTGKSTITNAILRISQKLTKSILLAAPTGRAAKRMSEITGKKAFTIHSLLEMDFTTMRFKKNKEHPLSCDLIIVDEASMIDTQLMYSLLKAIPGSARMVFVGDIDQLPSVGPGNVLRDMIDSCKVPVVRLVEIFRQAKGSDIITNAHRINNGEFPFLNGDKDFRFIEKETPEEVRDEILKLISKDLRGRFNKFDMQLLCPMKRGIIGTENLNNELQTILNPSNSPLIRMGRRFHKGDKVMQLRNNYEKEVFNGDVGQIHEIDLDEQSMTVEFDGRWVTYEFSQLDELILAYACSVHKYQGSECACVIIPVHTSHFKLLFRNLLYTGITRGKKLVILVGTKKAIAIAVKAEEVLKRHTGLTAMIINQSPEPSLL